MSMKLSRITTDKNVIKNICKNYEVTTQNFPLHTSKLFYYRNCTVYVIEIITASIVNVATKKHSNRMHTACLQTVLVLLAATRCQYL